jgi:PTH1 family peptidyl-tRNA hydrolase
VPDSERKFVVGLGNPGRKYRRTRHNVGFEALAELIARFSADGPREAFAGELWQARPAGLDEQVLLLAPQTYMNRSGRAVAEMLRFYKASPGDLMVVYDDMALEAGQLRCRQGGSAGGHNGLADVIAALGTDEVPRLRIGIGAAPPRMDAADYVLGKFTEDEIAVIGPAVDAAADAVQDWLRHGIRYVMDRYNQKASSAEPGPDRKRQEP